MEENIKKGKKKSSPTPDPSHQEGGNANAVKISKEKKRHERAMSFVEENKDLFQVYAGPYSLRVEPAPIDLPTFAYDLKEGKIYVNDMFWEEGMSELEKIEAKEKSAFAVRHEIGHMSEHRKILEESEEDNPQKIKGQYIWDQYLKKIDKEDECYDEAYSLTDNCVSDIHQNKTVIFKTNPDLQNVEKKIYLENCFPNNDGENLDLRFQIDQYGVKQETPKHIQLAQALLVENRSREVLVDQQVREVINKLKNTTDQKTGKEILDFITDPDIPMSFRLYYQDFIIWPEVEKLRKEDFKSVQPPTTPKIPPPTPPNGRGETQNTNSKNKKDETETTSAEYNEAFKEAYKRAKKQMLPKAEAKQIKKSGEEYLKNNPNFGENKKEKSERLSKESEENRAKDLGVKVEDLRNYKSLSNQIRNSKHYEVLNDLIKRIVSERKKERHQPKYPLDEGEEIIDPAQFLAETKSGNLRPEVWEDTEIKEYKGKLFSEIEMSLVMDRSGSMQGEKIMEVQKAIVLFMNSQKDLQDEIKEGTDEDYGLMKGLKVSWEIYSYQNTSQDFIPVKAMSDQFSEKDRINVTAHFNQAPGSRTTDANCLKAIFDELEKDGNKKDKLKDRELKKIIIVMTDGDSNMAKEVSDYLKRLKDLNVAVIGIGITQAGANVLITYGADSRIAEKAEDVSQVLSEIIENQFQDLLPLRG